ncbi:hypothetical protein [Mesorhizobium caraganae]|uniref:hypothetical protein n=1 Tax=Mesorhizobium caraganae TaxID=483206 RepID=UPI001FED8A52|nr:hypothetical protein [Mesorhizobium caraganae]
MLVHEIREVRDQPTMAACSQNKPTPPGNRIVLICRQPADRLVREPFEAADTRGRGQVRERLSRCDACNDRHAQQARNQLADRRRSLGHLHLADIVDRPFQPSCRRFDEDLRCPAQIESASGAELLRHQFGLVEGCNPASTGGTSIAQAATMQEAGDARCQPPLPPKIWRLVAGKALRAILHPGRTIPARVLAQRQQKR